MKRHQNAVVFHETDLFDKGSRNPVYEKDGGSKLSSVTGGRT